MRENLRVFKTQPGFAAAVVLALGLCLGANSAVFTVLNALVLRPLPFPGSDRLVEISIAGRRASLADLESARSIEASGAFEARGFAVAGAEGVRTAFGFRVTRDLIPLLGVRPAAGRALTRDDFGQRVAMIGYGYWKRLGGRPDITGQTLTVDGERYAIAGVLPADFFLGVRDTALVIPDLAGGERTIARLRPGATAAQVQAEITGMIPGALVEVIPLERAFQGNASQTVLLWQATAVFVLLITCANLANLQLVRGVGRRREFAIRRALGASQARLMLALARESAVLAVTGAAVGLFATRVLHDAILNVLPANISRRLSGADALPLDWRVAAFTAGIALGTIMLFGLAPALSALRFDVIAGLRDAGRGAIGGRQRFGRALVVVEIALALMLLAGAGLSVKSVGQLQSQYLGFRPEGVLRVMTNFSLTRYSRAQQQAALFQEVQRRLGGIAGVARVGVIAPQVFPFGGERVRGARFEMFGRPEVEARAEVYAANPAYREAVGLPLVRGRWFTETDTLATAAVAVVSESVAKRYWGREECVGQRVRLNSARADSEWSTIVGVVGDVKNPLADHWQPTAYRPFKQAPSAGATLMVRASVRDAASLAGAVRRELQAVDTTAPEPQLVASLDAAIFDYVSPQRFMARLLAVFAAIGLALAVAGVHGVMRYWVASRTGEIGIRAALGAQKSDLLALVLGRAAVAAAIGVAGGLAGAAALRRVMAAQLYGVSAVDPAVLAGVAVGMFAVALLAAWMPARWAARVDPAEALRAE